MANDLSARQWLLDTAGSTLLWPFEVKIIQIEFESYAADTDTCTVTDRNGKLVWQGNGSSDLQTVRSGRIGWVEGLKLTALTSGKVLVYLE